MSVHYKFKSALDYDTVTFDGLHISVGDLKASISQQKRIGKTSDFDLQITNAQTKEVYVDDNTLIPKNTSLLVARVPLSQQPKKQWEGNNNNASSLQKDVSVNKGLADLSRMEGSEQDKINAMISQSTFDYDPSNYQKIRGQNQRGVVPGHYICYKCQKRGHWIKDCPAVNASDPVEIRRSTGIPRSFMVPVDGPKAPGAMMTPNGNFAVPAVDHEAYLASENAGGADTPTNAPVAPEPTIPDELICSLCRDLLTDAVMIPCCGNSFCDECIRGALLDSEDHECPDCREKEIAPTTLIPNRFLRNSVSSFRNQTGYSRRTPHRPSHRQQPVEPVPPAVVVHPNPPNGPLQQPPNVSGPPPVMKPPGMDTPPNLNMPPPRADEQRASTPTVDERRDPMSLQTFNRGPPPFVPGVPPGSRRYNDGPFSRHGPPPSYRDRFPQEPYQPPPPGIKDSPPINGPGEDPLEAFNRMIREKEMRARRREERRRQHSGSRSPPPRSRSPRSPRSTRSPRSPRSHRSPRSPRSSRSPRSPPRLRARSRGSSRLRYSRSRSISPRRLRRSPPPPWSPRRRRSRERSPLSLTRSPSPRRRVRSPLRFRSPMRSPPRSPPRSPLPPRSPHREPNRSPRPISPHRYVGVYEELLSPSRRNVEPPYGPPRFEPRNNVAPPVFPPLTSKPMPLMSTNITIQNEGLPGYRGRYEHPPFEDIPPGLEPAVPGFEPSPFEKPPFGSVGPGERDRLPPSNYRDPYRAPYVDGSVPYRDMPIPANQNEIPTHIDQTRYRDNFRSGPPYRDQSIPFRDGHPYRESGLQPPYRDNNFRGGIPPYRDAPYGRNLPYREGGFRDNPPLNYRDGLVPFRPPSADQREPNPANYHEPNFRDGYRDESSAGRDHIRSNFRPTNRSRGGSRRNPTDNERHREREGRERERYNEPRDSSDKRDPDKRPGHERNRDGRDDRNRDYDRDREHERTSPEKKARLSPKRSRDIRDKKRSESRSRYDREYDRESKREKKDEKFVEKSTEKSKEHRDKDKKMKDRKKKKREKEKELEKKKKRDKKEKKDKDNIKKEDDDIEKSEMKDDSESKEIDKPKEIKIGTENMEEVTKSIDNKSPEKTVDAKPKNDLYDEEASEAVDKEIIQNYMKVDENSKPVECVNNDENKEEPFDGIELQANADELDLKVEVEGSNSEREMLAPMPELSKWEVDEDNADKLKEPGEITSPEHEEGGGKVTSEIIKRAENAIFAKAVGTVRPIEIRKISDDRMKLYGDEIPPKGIKITIPMTDSENNDKRKRNSKTPPPRLSVKERLGGKVENVRRVRESRIVQSTVERVKSRSKTPKRDQPYRRVTVEKERNRKTDVFNRPLKNDTRFASDGGHRAPSPNREAKKKHYEIKSKTEQHVDSRSRNNGDKERKKSTLDEAHFEPDYDETVAESDNDNKDETVKKRERSNSPSAVETKKNKTIEEGIKLDIANVKRKRESESESSSESDDSTSSSSSDARKRKKKKKRSKKKKKRVVSESESESDSSTDDHKKKKKRRKHKKKSSKKKKKSSKHK